MQVNCCWPLAAAPCCSGISRHKNQIINAAWDNKFASDPDHYPGLGPWMQLHAHRLANNAMTMTLQYSLATRNLWAEVAGWTA